MELLVKTGSKFYGICIVAHGIQQLVYSKFLPVILPPWPSWIQDFPVGAWIVGALLIIAGTAIVFEKGVRTISVVLAGSFLLLVTCWHLPYQLFINPHGKYLGAWAHAFKALALAGGGFAVAGAYSNNIQSAVISVSVAEKIIPLGRIFFSTTMIVFGIIHFLYTDVVAMLVPEWMPGRIFWAYFGGTALICSGVAIILKTRLQLVGNLLGFMIFLWFILLHIPRAIADPVGNVGNEVTSAFQALGFSGIAFVIAHHYSLEGHATIK